MLKLRTIALISHASKVMLKILQARLQQYVNRELPDVLYLHPALLPPSPVLLPSTIFTMGNNLVGICRWTVGWKEGRKEDREGEIKER